MSDLLMLPGLGMFIAWDDEMNIVATSDQMVRYAEGDPDLALGIIDFAGNEAAGRRLREAVQEVPGAAGSGSWPEWIVGTSDFRVELGDPVPGGSRRPIMALVHKKSGHRRDRLKIEAEIRRRMEAANAKGEMADCRDLVGGPNRPLRLDARGRNLPWKPLRLSAKRAAESRPAVPLLIVPPAPKGSSR